ncbi:MAG TPA: ABC transporter ATP-binding protein [Chloroflexota bacterium]|jgi:ABC-2 type transport system ATP-binding protein|nr:ABC transporter ATP-binding protein [Chloroflexota bacterium]
MIQAEHLTKYYGPRAAVRDVTFEVAKGEILGFLGPNGAGKSTTMRMLTGYLPPTSGTAKIAGYDILTHSLEARRHIGYLPENVPLYPEMAVADYLHFMAEIRGLTNSRQRRQRVDAVMEQTNLTHMRDRLIAKLSKGYRQRVGLAQALVADPEVLILDEPTIGLDPKQIIETRNLIKSLAGEHTVILSTHILPEVSATCQRVIIINDGEIAAVDTPENLTRRLRGAETLQLEVRGPREAVAQLLRAQPQVLDVVAEPAPDGRTLFTVSCALGSDLREQLAAAVVGAGYGLAELRSVRLSLEEIFLRIITEEPQAEPVEA